MIQYAEEFSLATCVCLNITDNCNLACKYCFVHQKPHFMTLQTAKNSVDFVVKNLLTKEKLGLLEKPDETATITFFGGEPTLLWEEIVVPTVQYAEEKYANLIQFNMTTNGTLLNQKRIDFLQEHNIPILLSIDGNKAMQDINRPCKNGLSSFDMVAPNIPLILNALPDTTFRATLNQDNCKGLFENTYLFAIQQGFAHIFMCPNAREEWTEDNLEILHNEINKIWTYIAFSFLNDEEPINCTSVDAAFENILRLDLQNHYQEYENINPNRKVIRCGLGTSSFSIGYDGKIFACQEQDSRDTNDYFYIGDIYNGIDREKHLQIIQDYWKNAIIKNKNSQKCESCELRQVCIEETCPSVSYDCFGNFFTRPTVDCLFHTWMFENAIVVMDMLVSENNTTFKKYLERIYSSYLKEGK